MAGIQASGIGSGLDIAGLVSQLVAAERQPLDARLNRREQATTVEISALGSLKGALGSLRDSLSGLRTLTGFSTRIASSSDEDIFTASATSAVLPGTFSVEVVNLASAHKLASQAFAAGRTAVVGTGTLTLSLGGSSCSVAVDDSHKTLADIRDAINAAPGNPGISASILNEVGGSRLILTARQTGAANAIKVTQSGGDGGLAALVFDPSAPLTSKLTESTPAADALVRVNGFDYSSASNSVTGAVDGLTIDLKKADPGTEYTLTVGNDVGSVSQRIHKFVSDYNGLAKVFADLQKYDPATRKAGPLLGDAFVRGTEAQLRRDLSEPAAGATGTYRVLAEIGITTDDKGQLKIDENKLKAALDKDFDSVAGLFAGTGGVAARMYDRLDAALSSSSQLATRTEALNSTVKDIAKQREDVDLRMQAVEARYRAQFTALDSLMSKMQSTGSYLAQQLASLPK